MCNTKLCQCVTHRAHSLTEVRVLSQNFKFKSLFQKFFGSCTAILKAATSESEWCRQWEIVATQPPPHSPHRLPHTATTRLKIDSQFFYSIFWQSNYDYILCSAVQHFVNCTKYIHSLTVTSYPSMPSIELTVARIVVSRLLHVSLALTQVLTSRTNGSVHSTPLVSPVKLGDGVMKGREMEGGWGKREVEVGLLDIHNLPHVKSPVPTHLTFWTCNVGRTAAYGWKREWCKTESGVKQRGVWNREGCDIKRGGSW